MQQYDSDHHPAKSAEDAMQEPADFVGQVAGPDDQPLRERKVSEEHHEGQRELAEIVELRGLNDLAIRAIARQHGEHDDAEAQRRKSLSHQEYEAVDGRTPLRIE